MNLYRFRCFRYVLTIVRLVYFVYLHKKITHIEESERSIKGTSQRNKKSLLSLRDCYSGQRSSFVLNQFSSLRIGPLDSMNVLIVGPRNESELFNFYGAGFSPKNITAIDLFTYSPRVKMLDVYDLRMLDQKYDVIYLGFMIAYQKTPDDLISYLTKFLNSRGIIAVCGEFTEKGSGIKPVFTQFYELTEISRLFPSDLEKMFLDEYVEDLFLLRSNARCYCAIYRS